MKDRDKNGADSKITIHAETYGKFPLYFVQNNGQMDERIKFYGKGDRHTVFFASDGAYFSVMDNLHPRIIKLIPLGAHKTSRIIAEDLQKSRINYLIGSDPGTWKTNIPTYKTINYKDVYKGIDMRFYGNNHQLEYDIVVQPGTELSCIQFAYRGIEDLKVTEEGDLEVYLKDGKIVQKKPYVYQEIEGKRVEIDGRFKIRNLQSKIQNPQFTYGFQIASYDRRHSLIIDPVVVYSTYLGGGGPDCGRNITVDASGNVYVTGETWSYNFPKSFAACESEMKEARYPDVFITKIDTSGNNLVYSTYLGGSNDDAGRGIAVDTSGNAYITGVTNSHNFPTVSAISTSKAGESDAFVAKLDASGNLIYSTYLGGSGFDWGHGIAIDASGNAYVTGWTDSQDFPTTPTTYRNKPGGYHDAFVTKLNNSGSNLTYSTYLGGSNYDTGNGIAVDVSGNVYVTGCTNSIDFPVESALCRTYAGGYHDAFVTKLDIPGNRLVYSTYVGGNNDDVGYGITTDTSGNAYIAGLTWSTNFPTVSAVCKKLAGNNDAFITKLNPSGNSLIYSTYLGGSAYDGGYGIAVDAVKNVYVAGVTCSDDFPVTSAISKNLAGGDDAFITKLDSSGSSIIYSTYLGGNDSDVGYGIAVDASRNVYVTGQTWSDTFPTSSAMYGSKRGDFDVFITKIAPMKNKIRGYVADSEDNPVGSVTLRLTGTKTISSVCVSSNTDGFFEFDDLDADTYTVSVAKNGYKGTKRRVKLGEDKVKAIVIKMTKRE